MSLSDLITIGHRNVRSVNLDEDFGRDDVLNGYSPGAHVVDGVRRIASGLQDGPRTRAWSVTGPYGAGKSSFALFLTALVRADRDPLQSKASKLLRQVDPQLAATLARERKRLEIGKRGMIPALAVATREPTVGALLRALKRGAEAYWSGPGRKPSVLHALSEAVADEAADAGAMTGFIDELCDAAPVLIVVDELGKTLEYAADGSGEGDLYVLQQLAERLSSSERFDGMVMTLQHLAFEDYLIGAGEARRREWRKIHGRFEDLPFVGDSRHAWRLTADALEPRRPTSKSWVAIRDATVAAQRGVSSAAPHLPDPTEIAETADALYPLHPLTALTLPPLTARLGQHDRSLVAFLASDAPHALPAFLSAAGAPSAQADVEFLRLDALYDYFFEDGAATALLGAEGAQAREIQTRVDSASDLDPLSSRLLKSAAILNLASGTHGLKASEELLLEAVSGPSRDSAGRELLKAALAGLVERSLLTFRGFAGEYRVWEGSDFDITGQIAAARERLVGHADAKQVVLDTVRSVYPIRPAVAQRYSQRRHVLRYFDAALIEPENLHQAEIKLDGADGLVAWTLSEDKAPAKLPAETVDGRPLVVVWSPHLSEIRELSLDVSAANAVLAEAPELASDPIARREVRHRVAALQNALIDAVASAFDHGRDGVRWFAGDRARKAKDRAAFSLLISEICEERFDRTPAIRNEMLNRRDLTSQGAKARRQLTERMFSSHSNERMEIEGYGPDRAMYEAVLRHTGLHAERDPGTWSFGPPPKGSELAEVWQTIMDFFDGATAQRRGIDELYGELLAPPFGLKEGPLPVLLSAALIYRNEDVFLYQEGSFQPAIDATHIERLVKAPERFAVKRAALLGLRAEVFEQLRGLVTGPESASTVSRNASTLAVVRPLIGFANRLPEYARQTSSVSDVARDVGRVLLEASEPDELLFRQLPEACGFPAIPLSVADGDVQVTAQSSDFTSTLRGALAELGGAYDRLLDQIAELIRHGFCAGISADRLREDLRNRALRLAPQVIDPKLRAFLLTAGDMSFDDDREWLEALAMTLAAKPPSAWSDHDLTIFEALVAERAGWFRRLELLAFETHSRGDLGFEARRLTLTAPDGTESHELVAVDTPTQELVGDILDRALKELTERVGGQAAQKMLGALAARVLTDPTATPQEMKASKPERRSA